MKQHNDIFSYLDEAFGFVDDSLIDNRIDEHVEIGRVYRKHPPVSLAKNDAVASVITHCQTFDAGRDVDFADLFDVD